MKLIPHIIRQVKIIRPPTCIKNTLPLEWINLIPISAPTIPNEFTTIGYTKNI
jgi:hypothetical protein